MLRNGCKCSNNSEHRHLSLLNILKEDNTKVGKLGGDCILHKYFELFILLTLSFDEGFHSLPYHVLHLIPGKTSRL